MSDWNQPLAPVADEWDDAPALPAPDASAMEPGDGAYENLVVLDPQATAREIREALLATPDLARTHIDASAVERLPGPLLQVLLAAMREAQAQGQRLTVRNPSFAFSLTFEAYGLGGENEPFNVEYS